MKKFMLDSGAFTAWNKGKEINLQKYIDFIKENNDKIDYYINLDVISKFKTSECLNDAAVKSYKNYLEMKRQGLNPIPVFHYGEKIDWLYRYLDETDYVGLGGAGHIFKSDKRQKWYDFIFNLLSNSQGKPTVKVHGFGVGSFELIKKYPWCSVDSTTYIKAAINGELCVYIENKNKFIRLPVTEKTNHKSNYFDIKCDKNEGLKSLISKYSLNHEELKNDAKKRIVFNFLHISDIFKNKFTIKKKMHKGLFNNKNKKKSIEINNLYYYFGIGDDELLSEYKDNCYLGSYYYINKISI